MRSAVLSVPCNKALVIFWHNSVRHIIGSHRTWNYDEQEKVRRLPPYTANCISSMNIIKQCDLTVLF